MKLHPFCFDYLTLFFKSEASGHTVIYYCALVQSKSLPLIESIVQAVGG